jgi:hypothetical protein
VSQTGERKKRREKCHDSESVFVFIIEIVVSVNYCAVFSRENSLKILKMTFNYLECELLCVVIKNNCWKERKGERERKIP